MDDSRLTGMVREGKVSSVDIEKGTARVEFEDRKTDDQSLMSGNLKILKNPPLIIVRKTKTRGSFTTEATYASVDRKLGMGESYDKASPDNIDVIGTVQYEGETKEEVTYIEVHPWMPYIGQMVVCLYTPSEQSNGYVLGGL